MRHKSFMDHNIHFVQGNFKGKNKEKGNQQPFNAKATTTFKKKKKNMSKMSCFNCGELEHLLRIVQSMQTVKRRRSTS
jgi:hypothetical protein